MRDTRTDNVEKAQAEAERLGIAMDIIPHETSGRATEDAAAALGIEESLVLKMMILVDKKTGKNAGVLVRGDERIDQKKLRALTQLKSLRFAHPEEVEAITGYVIGGVPPIALVHCDYRLVSVRVQDVPFVYGSGGSEFSGMRIAASELARIAGVTFCKIST